MTARPSPAAVRSQSTPRRGVERIRKPWGEELILSRRPGFSVKLLRIRPGQRLSLQYHRRKDETLLVLGGEVDLTIGAQIENLSRRRLSRGERIHIPARAIHRLAAVESAAEILEFVSHPPNQADRLDDDIVRLADDFGRI